MMINIEEDEWIDNERKEAENANERPMYYRVYYNMRTGVNIKMYKPSLAALVIKRRGDCRMELLG